MIRATIAKVEGRSRDKKRRRVVLEIGGRAWHLTPLEALKVASRLHEAASRALSSGIKGKSK